MLRNRKFALYLTLAIVGAAGIAVVAIPTIGDVRAAGLVRVLAGTIIIALAMAWACAFATRAHFAQDEFGRQREIAASFWGGCFGIAASAPVFFFIAAGGLAYAADRHIPPVDIFVTGYLLPTIFALIGAVVMRKWLRRRDLEA